MYTKEQKSAYNKKYAQQQRMVRLMQRIQLREANAEPTPTPSSPPPKVRHKKMSYQGWEDKLPDPTKGQRVLVGY